jgi:hypothetical protein
VPRRQIYNEASKSSALELHKPVAHAADIGLILKSIPVQLQQDLSAEGLKIIVQK